MWRLLPFAAVVIAQSCLAQDPGQMAAMQAQQVSMQVQQDMMTQQTILNQQTATDMSDYRYGAAKPSVHVEPGGDSAHVIVRLKDRTRESQIFYTTDGWTPTPVSARYEGPLTLQSGSVLRAIAIAPGALRSAVTVWPVAAPGQASPKPKFVDPLEGRAIATAASDVVRLEFTAPVVSHGMQVGDKLPVALAGDLVENGKVVAAKDTPVLVTITQIDGKASFGRPAEVTFAARSLALPNGFTVNLVGGERLEGEPHAGRAASLFFVPIIGVVNGALVHGEAADIPQGATFPAKVIWSKTESAKNDAGQ